MRHTNTQTMSNILVINDLIPTLEPWAQSLIHWDFPEEDEEPCGKLSLDCGDWDNGSDEQEWQDDYIHSIRL